MSQIRFTDLILIYLRQNIHLGRVPCRRITDTDIGWLVVGQQFPNLKTPLLAPFVGFAFQLQNCVQTLPVLNDAPLQVPIVVCLSLAHFHLFDALLVARVVVPAAENALGQSQVVPIDGDQ